MDAPSPYFFVPFRKPDLIGRANDLDRVHTTLQNGQTAAVTPALVGQGGIGKTQLAVLYAHEHAGAYPAGVFWVDAAKDAEPIASQLGDFALRMGIAQPQGSADGTLFYRQLAEAWIGQAGSNPKALLVADNLEEPDYLTKTLPGLPSVRLTALGCRTLITTRQRDMPGCSDIALDFLDADDAKALLLREAERPANSDGADAIARLLGGLPLAIRLAGALIKQNPGVRLDQVATTLRERGAVQMLDEYGQPLEDYRDGIKVSIAALLAESWNELPANRPELKAIVTAIACFPESQQVRAGLLRWLVECPDGPFGPEVTYNTALTELFNRNLIERPDDAHLRLHPLVREYAAGQAKDDLAETLVIRAAVQLRSSAFLAAQDAESLLTLLRELPTLMELADDPDRR